MKYVSKVVTGIILSLLPTLSTAQVATGTPPFGSFGGGPFDSINLGNLNVHFAIPVLHKAGRGVSFAYDLSYDSSIWYQATVQGVVQWAPTVDWGWISNSYAVLGTVTSATTSKTISGKFCGGQFGGSTTSTTTYAYLDSRGRSHAFPGSTTDITTTCPGSSHTSYGPGFTATATDSSGYTLTVAVNTLTGATSYTVVTRSGITVYNGNGTYTDANGNQLTVNSSTGQFYDTSSSTTAVLTQSGSGTPSSPVTYTYVAPSGGNAAYTVNYTQYTVQTAFGVSGVAEYGPTSNNLVSSIQLPDGTEYAFTYEAGPTSCSPCITGRIKTVTLPAGGTITYQYTGGSNGIESDGSTAGLTRTLSSGGEWQYSRALQANSKPVGPGSTWTTTVADPSGNYTVLNFAEDSTVTNTGSNPATIATYNFYETQRQVYQGGISSNSCSTSNPNNCLLFTSTRCYNASYSGCGTSTVGSGIGQVDYYTQPAGGQTRLSEVLYNVYGNVYDDKEYNYGVTTGAAPGTSHLVRETATTYGSYNGSGCTALGNGIYSKPCQLMVYDWSSGSKVLLASSTFAYDQTSVQTTSGTPQHTSVTGSRGNLTTVKTQTTSSGSMLSRTISYYDTGTPYIAADVNGAQTTYIYGSSTSCGNSFPTQINEPLSLSQSMQWNCTGAVATQVTDENGDNVASNYTDPDFWRPFSITDQMGNQTDLTYNGEVSVETALQNFNGGNSSSDSLTTVDGFGRPVFAQRKQGPSTGNYDTVETDYNTLGQPYRSTMPYTATASPSSQNTTVAATTRTYDALGRVLTITDADNGTVSYTYTATDILQQVSGGQTFSKQFEYDGLGRLTSVCEISATLPGVGTCGQTTQKTGYWTKYTYDALSHLLTVTQNAQAASGSQQTRAFAYDMLGRMTSESNPETGNSGKNGTATYTYDGGCTTTPAACGNLTAKLDAAGNTTNYTYDLLHRILTAGNSGISGATLRVFVYDSKTSYPTGVTVVNAKTRMVEATTTTTSGSTITDEFFSYDKRGELTDLYESTPHSSGYYHTTAAYWPTGTLQALSGIPGVPTINYGANGAGLDGEGRVTEVTAASGTNPVTGVTYSPGNSTAPLGALTNVTFGSADSDAFTYDPNTGRPASYTFSVNGKTDVGALTWNANGTLTKLAINDQIPGTTDTQTCTYAYDDLQRVSNTTCGTLWGQNFTYDAFGNIAKNVPQGDGGLTFLPTYWTAPPTNQFSALPGVTPKYDGNGNLLTDNLNTYTWDPNWGTMTTATPSGGSSVTATYDALGRMIENNAGGSYTEFVYGPTGAKLAKCNGQTLVKAFIALPGGAKAIYNSTGLAYYRHSDWLGSSRLTSTASRTLYSSSAYAPFGEQYATSGSADASFTGQDQDTVANLYDFPARRQSPSQGRWISPDPLGIGAVSLTIPQTWNRYAHVINNPLKFVDPTGMQLCDCNGDDDDGGGGGDDDGGGPPPDDPGPPTPPPSDPGSGLDPQPTPPDPGGNSGGGGDIPGFCDASNSCTPDVGINGVPWNWGPGYAGQQMFGLGQLLGEEARYYSIITTGVDPSLDPCAYLNDSGTGLDTSGTPIDTHSSQKTCSRTGGVWIPAGSTIVFNPDGTYSIMLSQQLMYQSLQPGGQYWMYEVGQAMNTTPGYWDCVADQAVLTAAASGLSNWSLPAAGKGLISGTIVGLARCK